MLDLIRFHPSHSVQHAFFYGLVCLYKCVCAYMGVLLFTVLTPGRLRHQAPACCGKLAILLRG